MSWSLQLSNGDISFGSKGLNTATGSPKLVQDLTCALLTEYGSSALHPEYGSTLNNEIGQIDNAASQTFISAEVQRVIQYYQAQQITRNNNDLSTYGKSTLTLGEALLTLNNIQMQQLEDVLQVIVSLTTGRGTTVTTTVGVS